MSDRPSWYQWPVIVAFGLYGTVQTGEGGLAAVLGGFLGAAFVAFFLVVMYNSRRGKDEQPAEARSY